MAKTHANNSFTLQLPGGWHDNTVHCFAGPEERGRQHLLTVLVDDHPHTDDPRAYATLRRDQLIQTMPGVEVLKDEPKTLSSGLAAHELVCKLAGTQSEPTFRKQVFVLTGKKAYTFSADFSKRTLKTIGLVVESMIESFEP